MPTYASQPFSPTVRRDLMATNSTQPPRAPAQNTSMAGSFGMGSARQNAHTTYDAQGNASTTYGRQGMQDAGSRNMGSVNWGAFGGITNAYDQMPAGQARDQFGSYLRSQGLMPSYNGIPYDQIQQNDPRLQGHTTHGSGIGGGISGGQALGGLNRMAGMQGTPALGMNAPQQPGGMFGGGFGGGLLGSGAGGQGGMFNPQIGMGVGGGRSGGGGLGGFPTLPHGGGSGPTGLPLEGSMTGAIQGILRNPSPFSATQTQQMRNQATSGNNAAAQTEMQRYREDAARRGVNPGEIEGSLGAIGQRFARQGQQQGLDFDLAQAQASRQGLLSGLGAGQSLMNSQIGNESSIRQYLAALAAAQGNAPMFLGI